MLSLEAFTAVRGERRLFEPLTLASRPGDFIELTGPNGAGKSTLLRTLAGIHQQFEGEFTCEDYLFQGHRLGVDELLNPLENLQFAAQLRDRKVGDAQIRSALERVGLAPLTLTPSHQLSQGQQRRIAVARWLLSAATVWLLDEPLTALDVDGQDLLTQLLNEHCAAGGVIVAATHHTFEIPGKRSVELQVHDA